VAFLFEKTDGGQSARDVLLPVLDKLGVKYEAVGADPTATEGRRSSVSRPASRPSTSS